MKSLWIMVAFTTACGGVAFRAGETTVNDGGSPSVDGESPELDGGFDAVSDKASTDGGLGSDSAGLDGGFEASEDGDAAADAPYDAADACFEGTAHLCTESDFQVIIQPDEYCVGGYAAGEGPPSAVTSLTAVKVPVECACANDTCACIQQTYPQCGQAASTSTYLSCTGSAVAGLMVRCEAP